MWVNTKSKFYKVLISVLVACILVFSIEVNKPRAFVPLAWAGYVLAGMAVETLVEMGVKASSKAVMKKYGDDVAQKALLNGDFDFMKSKPYKNKDGSLVLKPTANDRAKMAWLIAGGAGGLIDMAFDDDLDDSCVNPVDLDDAHIILPWILGKDANGNPSTQEDLDYARQYVTVTYTRTDANNVTYHMFSNVTGLSFRTLSDTNVNTLNPTHVVAKDVNSSYLDFAVGYQTNDGLPRTKNNTNFYVYESNIGQNYRDSDDLANSNGEDLVMCGGLSIPSTVKNVYPVPMNMADTYLMPNHDELENRPIIIKNVMPVSETEGDIEWSEVENHYLTDNSSTFESDVDNSYVDTYIKGDVNNTTYNIQEINNYYTDKDEEVKVIDFHPDIEQVVVVPPDDDDDSGTVVHNPHVEHVEELNQGMFAIMKNSYDYLGDSLDNALLSMKDVTDDATGIIVYLDTAFDWLPSQWRALFGSAFVLGIFAHFFRR